LEGDGCARKVFKEMRRKETKVQKTLLLSFFFFTAVAAAKYARDSLKLYSKCCHFSRQHRTRFVAIGPTVSSDADWVCWNINLCSQGPGTEVTSPEVYESIESEQYVFPAVKEDGILSSHTKLQMNCSIQQKVTAS
jgi:hypothetical protein